MTPRLRLVHNRRGGGVRPQILDQGFAGMAGARIVRLDREPEDWEEQTVSVGEGVLVMALSTSDDPYEVVSELLDLALGAALEGAAADPSGLQWRDAILAIGIAQMGLPTAMGAARERPLSCSELLRAARDGLAVIPADQRTPDHALNFAYLQDALRAVEAAEQDEAPGE